MKRWFTFLAAATAAFGSACLNDRDTLAYEARRFPGILEAVAGRFERNPATYYQMRIDRIDRQGGPKTLGEYDDQATAYDRIGNDDRAIEIIKNKAKLMHSMGDRATKMDWYRYHANIGTFQIHRWFHNGANAKRLDEAKEAAKHIEKSIELNPDAHFGREVVQLEVMNWMIATKAQETILNLGDWMLREYKGGRDEKKKTVAGLLGLMVLGAAWESVDVLDGLARLNRPEVSLFVALRIQELEKAGKKSLTGRSMLENVDKDKVHLAYYEKLRKNAERYDSNRKAFMAGQFAKGKHPDTDSDFWTGYSEVPPVEPLPVSKGRWRFQDTSLIVAGILILAAIGLYIRDRLRHRRLAGI